jgi:hypothetical protein
MVPTANPAAKLKRAPESVSPRAAAINRAFFARTSFAIRGLAGRRTSAQDLKRAVGLDPSKPSGAVLTAFMRSRAAFPTLAPARLEHVNDAWTRLLLGLVIALFGRRDQRGVYDLAAHLDVAGRAASYRSARIAA